MRKGKLIARILGVLVVLLAGYFLVTGVVIPLFDTSGEDVEEEIAIYGYVETGESYTLENDQLLFELDPATTHFSVTDKSSGKVWHSSPVDAGNDPVALPVEKNRLLSSLTLTYSTSTGMQTLMSSNEFSVQNGVYEVVKEEDAVLVNYSLGKISRTYVMPLAITEERMDVFLAAMDSKTSKKVKEYYRKYDINKLRKTDNKEELLATYPDMAEQKVYVLRDNTAEYLKANIEEYFAAAGYTQEDYEHDLSRIAGMSSEVGAVFNITLRYALEGDDLVVEIPMESIAYNPKYPISTIQLLPAFGAGGTEEEGFLLVPDGSGAIIRFNNGKISQSAYYANLYGWDWASIRKQITNETHADFPVFGISGEGGSFLCLMEEGAAWAGVNADISGRHTSYNTVNASYTIIHGDAYDVSERTNNAVYMFEQQQPEGCIRQRYRFLDSQDYGDMALAYRSYLLAQNPGMTAKEESAAPVVVDLVGAIDKVQQRFGVPTEVPIPLTTYAQARELLSDLRARGLEGMQVKYSGWFNGGLNQKILSSVRLMSEMGEESELTALTAWAKAQGIPLYLDGLTQYARNSGLLEGFVAFRDAAKFTTREEAEIPEYSSIWYGGQGWRDTYYLLRPSLMVQMMQNLADAAVKYGASGVSLRDTGSMLSADYDTKDTVTREESKAMQVEQLKAMGDQGLGVMIRYGNSYAAPLADTIIDMDFDGGEYGIIDMYVPFYPMALHGLVTYTGEALNLAADREQLLLLSAEMGAGLQLCFTASDAKALQESWYSEYYGADYNLSRDWALETWARYNAALGHLFQEEITAHERLGDVALTTYSDGSCVMVNYGYEDEEIRGTLVPARDYLVVKEAK